MSEYTPTTDRVRADYAETYEGTDERRYERFDRWLNSVKAEAWDEAVKFTFRKCVTEPQLNTRDIKDLNPYRTGGAE